MQESSIITGKVTTEAFGPGATSPKKLYVKIFPGAFTLRPPRLKQPKTLIGELLVRYSSREWPEKRNGTLIGDKGFLSGISELLSAVGLINVSDISYSKNQKPLKETITIKVGTVLAKEIVERGWVYVEESLVPMASRAIPPAPDLDIVLPTVDRDMIDDGPTGTMPPHLDLADRIKGEKDLPIKLDPTLLDLQPLEKSSTKVIENDPNLPEKDEL